MEECFRGWYGTILGIEMLDLFGLRLFPKEGVPSCLVTCICRLVQRHWLGKISGASFLARFKLSRGRLDGSSLTTLVE
jgi:hypothetical protein